MCCYVCLFSRQHSSICCRLLLLLAHHTSSISRHRLAQWFSLLMRWLGLRCRCQHNITPCQVSHRPALRPVMCLSLHLPQPISWKFRYVGAGLMSRVLSVIDSRDVMEPATVRCGFHVQIPLDADAELRICCAIKITICYSYCHLVT